MKLGSALLMQLFFIVAVRAEAASVCRDLFKPSLHSLDGATVDALSKDVETVSDRISWHVAVDRFRGNAFSINPKDLNQVLRSSARLLHSQGAKIKVIRHKGYPALEITPDAAARPGWNKMAASLQQKLNARLVFAPATLAKFGSRALHTELHDGSHVIVISRESLKRGRGDYLVAEEIGHTASGSRARTDPHPFTGAIETIDSSLRPSIAEKTNSYRDQMTFDEMPRAAKNFARVARTLEQGSRTARRELISVAKNARDAIKITRVAVDQTQSITRSMMIAAEGSGFAMNPDMTPKANAAFVYAEADKQVFVEAVSRNVVRLNFEGNGFDIEIFVRDPNGSLSSLIPGLQTEQAIAIKRFQARLPGVINDWARAQNVAMTGLVKSIRAVAGMRSRDDKTLARDIRAAATDIAPLMVRHR